MDNKDLHQLRPMQSSDWPYVRSIYEMGIASGIATFEEKPPSWEIWDREHLEDCRIVAVEKDRVVGWVALSRVSTRCVYQGVGEVSVYVHSEFRGHGIGKKLLKALVHSSEEHGIWTLQAGIFPENTASIEIHKKAGFRIVGIREKVGRLNGSWKDVVLMERRSRITGQ